ncbi:PREDICTED: vegetative cell wall protein gp1-like [Elephantulus edwardii]|uniref:vegetative cell wall protein gp1-like n=1 Tax=Elephantulus edwardii TaxID=28737 RepID=UPI0003F0E16F|nr:PREDICTED: vegetative cell wall protein gp1-like [Elephantulus edwardii]
MRLHRGVPETTAPCSCKTRRPGRRGRGGGSKEARAGQRRGDSAWSNRTRTQRRVVEGKEGKKEAGRSHRKSQSQPPPHPLQWDRPATASCPGSASQLQPEGKSEPPAAAAPQERIARPGSATPGPQFCRPHASSPPPDAAPQELARREDPSRSSPGCPAAAVRGLGASAPPLAAEAPPAPPPDAPPARKPPRLAPRPCASGHAPRCQVTPRAGGGRAFLRDSLRVVVQYPQHWKDVPPSRSCPDNECAFPP